MSSSHGPIVLKFGSSVLRSEDDLPRVVAEIYRWWRGGRPVVAVVSAIGETTDRLTAQVQAVGDGAPEASAALLATGERASAALLRLQLARAGIPARLLDVTEVGLVTEGPLHESRPVALDVARIQGALDAGQVVVLPGFIGTDADGRVSLLGRGGSDLSALFVSQRLGARCRLIKDVDGLYTHDPARPGPPPRRYASLTWRRAAALDPRIIQPHGVRFAAAQQQPFEVAAPGGSGTRVGRGPTRLAEAAAPRRPLRVGLLGLGTVGLGVYRLLARRPETFEVVGIAVREPARHTACVPAGLLCADPWAVVRAELDVVVELIGGRDPACELIRTALVAGRHVVTANKEVVGLHGPELELLARQHGATLAASASVGGVLPAIEAVARAAAAAPIRRLRGVLNGTTNVILDRMADGLDYAQAVQEAQHRGFAEADPWLDVSGYDAACKLAILARAAFGLPLDPDAVVRRGIEGLPAGRQPAGRRWRLVADVERGPGGLRARVRPCRLAPDDPLADVRREGNRLIIEPVGGPPVTVDGKGAGRWPTAHACLADLLALAARREPAVPRRAAVALGV